MKKSTTTANHSPKGRTATAATKADTKSNRMYMHGKKIAGRLLNILNYKYKDSDLEQFVF